MPATRLLHPASPSLAAPTDGSALPSRAVFTATHAVRVAQLIALAQGAVALVTSVSLIEGGMSLARVGSGVNLPATPSLAANYGFGVGVIGVLFIVGAILVSRPSQIARTLLVLLELVTLGVTLAAHFGGGSVLGVVTVLAMGASGSALIPFGAVVGLQSVAIYLLAIHPPTYGAFARTG